MAHTDFEINPGNRKYTLLSSLLEAITKVDKSFIIYSNLLDNQHRDEKVLHTERVFAYELYHKWRITLKEYGVDDLVINAEIPKIININIKYKSSESENESQKIFPDLILHNSQGTNNSQNIACEIKRAGASSESIFADIAKLTCLLDRDKFSDPFDKGVFIYVNNPDNCKKLHFKMKTKIQIDNIDITFQEFINNENYKSHFKDIIIVEYDGNNFHSSSLELSVPQMLTE